VGGPSLQTLLLTLALAVVSYVVTHLVPIPYGLRDVMAATGPILGGAIGYPTTAKWLGLILGLVVPAAMIVVWKRLFTRAHGASDPPGEPHTHCHEHKPMRHTHPNVPDMHHTHRHQRWDWRSLFETTRRNGHTESTLSRARQPADLSKNFPRLKPRLNGSFSLGRSRPTVEIDCA
jgi:hypothetical protein